MPRFSSNMRPVAICGGIPDWYKGAWYKKLAPKWSFFSKWKETHDNDYYIEHFQTEVLDKLTPQRVLVDLQLLLPIEVREEMQEPIWKSKDYHIVLLCYEKTGEFCHRHLVADWLNKNGVECKEWDG